MRANIASCIIIVCAVAGALTFPASAATAPIDYLSLEAEVYAYGEGYFEGEPAWMEDVETGGLLTEFPIEAGVGLLELPVAGAVQDTQLDQFGFSSSSLCEGEYVSVDSFSWASSSLWIQFTLEEQTAFSLDGEIDGEGSYAFSGPGIDQSGTSGPFSLSGILSAGTYQFSIDIIAGLDGGPSTSMFSVAFVIPGPGALPLLLAAAWRGRGLRRRRR